MIWERKVNVVKEDLRFFKCNNKKIYYFLYQYFSYCSIMYSILVLFILVLQFLLQMEPHYEKWQRINNIEIYFSHIY